LHAVDETQRPETVDPAANVHTERFADRLLLDDALDQLSDDLRIAVVLRDVADLDYAEIAEVLDVPIGTVKSRISRGRAALAIELRLDDDRRRTRGNRSEPDERPMDPT
jgi:RNA polymerase sigma-70 factor (ECF subfamily)